MAHNRDSGDVDDAVRAKASESPPPMVDAASPSSGFRAILGRDYACGPNLLRPSRASPYKRAVGDPLYRPLWVYTSDPIQRQYDGAFEVLEVPYEPLEAGPSGALILVDDYDRNSNRRYNPVDLDQPAILLTRGLKPHPGDVQFHQQMVYAVASDVIARFAVALGRNPSWGFDRKEGCRDRLHILPHYEEDKNAYYDRLTGELRFGYLSASDEPGHGTLPRGTVYTCLSYDIVAHETAHALLDGMRRRFLVPTNPDVLAFHEAFADLVAVLQHFTQSRSVKQAISRAVKLDDQLIWSIAEQFGRAAGLEDGPLRIAIDQKDEELKYPPPGQQMKPHELGSVLVRAVIDAMREIYQRRTERLEAVYSLRATPTAKLNTEYRDLLAAEAAKTAGQILNLCIRAIDYCPPVDLTFGEYLRALITADRDLVEDDHLGYREALIGAFGRRRIYPSDVQDLSEPSLLWRPPSIRLPSIGRGSLRLLAGPDVSDKDDEILDLTQQLADVATDPRYMSEFGLEEGGECPTIESVRTLRKVGPDRNMRFGIVAEIIQTGKKRVNGRTIEFSGGATVATDVDGSFRYVIRKRVADDARAARQAAFVSTEQGKAQCEAVSAGRSCLAHRGRGST